MPPPSIPQPIPRPISPASEQLELPLGACRPQRRRRREPPTAQRWQAGAPLPWLGESLILQLDGARARAERCGERLCLPLPPDADAERIRDRAQGWLQGEARRVLGERLAACARQRGVPAPAWRLGFAAGHRVELDADGRLRLPWRLVQLALADIDRRLLEALDALHGRADMNDIWDAEPLSA